MGKATTLAAKMPEPLGPVPTEIMARRVSIYQALSPGTGFLGFFMTDDGSKRINIVFDSKDLASLQKTMADWWTVEYPRACATLGTPSTVEGGKPRGQAIGHSKKVGMNSGTKWIKKGAKRIRVPADQVEDYLKKGWSAGK